MSWLGKGLAIAVFFGLIGLAILAWPGVISKKEKREFGVTFSQSHATGIGLDWREVYQAILYDLGVKKLRLSAYWDQVEPEPGRFNFADLDYQLDAAEEAGAGVVLGVGRKLPRWPECHTPGWARGLSEAEQQAQVLELIKVVVERYRDHAAVLAWQVENEPLFDFGICPPADREFLAREVELVRRLSPGRKIIVTDSGELSLWLEAAQFGDELGTTMYRTVFSEKRGGYFSYDYIFPAWLYRVKARVIGLVYGKPVRIVELQGEPWGTKSFTELSREERDKSFSLERFDDLKDFSERTGLGGAYWWGVEYWYWVKTVEGDPAFWEKARGMF